ncbi:hypothetical protein F4778DRAFT_791774 [Xylariomycetidae sp. FL2044]|nr:hypothetical protein F4778DRAFT_791774 [Xylariomycetidae sp. FL2044]
MAYGDPVLYSLYVYAPDKIAPIIFAVLFTISAFFHIWQCYRYQAFRLIGLHPVCAVVFAAGYALRAYSAHNYLYDAEDHTSLLVFILSQVCIYVCPPLLELANYHVLGRIFQYVPHCTPFPPGRVLSTFGLLMLVVELLNSLGVALSSNSTATPAQQELGGGLTLAAIAIQVLVVLSFVLLASLFHRRALREDPAVVPGGARSHGAVRVLLPALYASMLLILARSAYRLAEHAGGSTKDIGDLASLRRLSPAARYEVLFYVFEAALMLLNSALWNAWSPARVLPRDPAVYLGADGREYRDESRVDRRAGWERVVNVLTFGLLCRSKKMKGKNKKDGGTRRGGDGDDDAHSELRVLRIASAERGGYVRCGTS